MPRQKVEVNKAEFQRVVNELESQREFTNPSELWQTVEKTEWAQKQQPKPLTAAVAYLRAREFGIVTKTKPGKRGGGLSKERMSEIQRRPRAGRAAKMGKFSATFEQIKKKFGPTFLPIINRAQKGSLKAALTLYCIECSGYLRSEVRLCPVTDCPLYPHRPGVKQAQKVNQGEAMEVIEVIDAA